MTQRKGLQPSGQSTSVASSMPEFDSPWERIKRVQNKKIKKQVGVYPADFGKKKSDDTKVKGPVSKGIFPRTNMDCKVLA